LLKVHPYIWLGERFADKRLMAGLMTILLLAIPFLFIRGYGLRNHFELVVPFFYIVSFFLLLWMVAEPIVRLNEDRRAGALELVLTTPLQGPEIVRGMQRSMERIFVAAGAVLVVAAALIHHYVVHNPEQAWVLWAPVLYLAACFWALRWVGPWIGLSSRSVTTGMLRALVMMGLPAMVWSAAIMVAQETVGSTPFTVSLYDREEGPVPGGVWIIWAFTLAIWFVVFLSFRTFFRSTLPAWRKVWWMVWAGVFMFLAISLSLATFIVLEDYFSQVWVPGFLLLHTIGMAILAYGWAKPQLQLRFRDLATRPFEN
jgi:hypothetical protein